MSKIVLTSHTSIGSSGGVPRWCRDFRDAFPEGTVAHYSWEDVPMNFRCPEWVRARALTDFLVKTKRLLPDDILVGDGFWADVSLHPVERTLQVAHGNWGHVTLRDAELGIQPEFPELHREQVAFRRRFADRGGRSVAVSQFIADQCRLQWDLNYPVINNGIDLRKFCPPSSMIPRKRPVIVHGVTNSNKGFDHVRAVERKVDADVLLLDDAARFFNSLQSERKLTKYQALAQADLVIVPSFHEGNSYFMLEALASDVPVVCYDVGLPYQLKRLDAPVGEILDRDGRFETSHFVDAAKRVLTGDRGRHAPRAVISGYSLERFQMNWKKFMADEFGIVS